MAMFTMYVRDLCTMMNERYNGTIYDNYEENINNAIPYIFKDFPLFNENHRTELCTKILKHYYMREIGMETYDSFILKLDERMNLIMPRYNEKYKTLSLDYEILQDVNLTSETGNTQTTSNKQNSNSTSNISRLGKENNLMSDTPQMNYANQDYATELNKNESETQENGNNNETIQGESMATGNTTTKTTGINGHTNMSLINEYRKNIINVDEEIIYNLSDLFMTIYDRW